MEQEKIASDISKEKPKIVVNKQKLMLSKQDKNTEGNLWDRREWSKPLNSFERANKEWMESVHWVYKCGVNLYLDRSKFSREHTLKHNGAAWLVNGKGRSTRVKSWYTQNVS